MDFQLKIGHGILTETFEWFDVDDACQELLKRSADELIGRHFDFICAKSDKSNLHRLLERAQSIGYAESNLLLMNGGLQSIHGRVQLKRLSTNLWLVHITNQDRTSQIEAELRTLASSTAVLSGRALFDSLTEQLAKILEVKTVIIAQYGKKSMATTVSAYSQGKLDNFSFSTEGSPYLIASQHKPCFYNEHVRQLFPNDELLAKMNAESYIGIPLLSSTDQLIGNISIIHDQPLSPTTENLSILKFFADRAATEIQHFNINTSLKETLETQKAMNDTIVEASGALVCVLAADGRVITFNQKCQDLTGFKREEIIGDYVWDHLIPDDEKEPIQTFFHSITAGNFPAEHQNHWLKADGSLIFLHWINTCTMSADGKIAFVIAVGIDITETQEAEEKLKLTIQQLEVERTLSQQILNTAAAPIFVLDEDLRIVEFNQHGLNMYGYTRDEIIGQSVAKFYTADNQAAYLQRFKEIFDAGERHNDEVYTIGKDGRRRLITRQINVFIDSTTGKKRLISVGIDITNERRATLDQKTMLKQLKSSFDELIVEQNFRKQILQTSKAAIVVLDHKGTYVDFNTGAEEISGYRRSEVIGKPATSLIPKEDAEKAADRIKAVATGDRKQGEGNIQRWIRKDGQIRWMRWDGSAFFDSTQNAMFHIGVGIDVTDTKLAQESLMHTNAELEMLNQELDERVTMRTQDLEAANRELESFSYSVSHDLRAPLRHITSFIELIAMKGFQVDSQLQKYLDIIKDSASRMSQLIEGLLDFSRMGRTELSLRLVDINGIVTQSIGDLSHETEGRSIEWKIENLPQIQCDRSLFLLVFQNLIGNAIKFTRNRDLAMIHIFSEQNHDFATIHIKDNGVGFDMQYSDKLFGVFQRLHRADEFEGTGIGLANVRRIIQRHGGTITASSELNQGTTFSITLPL